MATSLDTMTRTREHGSAARRSRVGASCALLSLLVACGEDGRVASPSTEAVAPTPGPEETELLVFAATSLRDAFTTMETRFEATHPGVDVTLQLAGTQELRAQIEAGAPADVLASADVVSMEALHTAGRVEDTTIFARNEPVLVVSREARERVTTFAELPRAERIVLGGPEVPIGRYALTILDNADRALAPGFRARVEAHVVSREPNVRQVLAKVAMGEAEAGIVYRTDVRGADPEVGVISIPTEISVIAAYPIATVEGAPHPRLAREWIELVLGTEGRTVLAEAGFLAAEAP